jgi:uncharacterized protein YicC (UPF0701 family)
MTPEPTQIQKAIGALKQLRVDLKKRSGKEGGNLNRAIFTQLDVVEAVLLQIPPIESMVKTIQQQAQLTTFAFRSLNKAKDTNRLENGNGDDGTSETKGE